MALGEGPKDRRTVLHAEQITLQSLTNATANCISNNLVNMNFVMLRFTEGRSKVARPEKVNVLNYMKAKDNFLIILIAKSRVNVVRVIINTYAFSYRKTIIFSLMPFGFSSQFLTDGSDQSYFNTFFQSRSIVEVLIAY